MTLPRATLHSSASLAITGCWMHQIPVGSFAVPPSFPFFHHGHCQLAQQNIALLSWTSCTARTMLVQEPGEDARTAQVLASSWNGNAYAGKGFDGFMDRNESSPSLRQFSHHPAMSPLYFDQSSVPVLWLLGLLCYIVSIPCHCPHSLTDSTHFSVRSVCCF